VTPIDGAGCGALRVRPRQPDTRVSPGLRPAGTRTGAQGACLNRGARMPCGKRGPGLVGISPALAGPTRTPRWSAARRARRKTRVTPHRRGSGWCGGRGVPPSPPPHVSERVAPPLPPPTTPRLVSGARGKAQTPGASRRGNEKACPQTKNSRHAVTIQVSGPAVTFPTGRKPSKAFHNGTQFASVRGERIAPPNLRTGQI
jgi:hypothetical protein